MAYYFASNNQAMFDRSSSLVVGTTLAGTFDPAVVDSSVLIPEAGNSASPPLFYAGMPLVSGGPSLTSKVYGHFEVYGPPGTTLNNQTVPFLQIVNAAGQTVFRVTALSNVNTFRCQFWDGAAFVNVGPVFGLTYEGLNTYDFSFLPGALGTFELRVNGSLTPAVAITTMNAAVNNFAAARIVNVNTINPIYISQGILADFDLRGAKVNSLRPSANGFYTAGTGTFSDVNTIVTNDTTGIGLPAVGNIKTFVKPALVTSGMVIDTAFINIKAGISGGIVNNARGIVRRAAVDSPTAAYSPAPTIGLQQAMLAMPLDPSTSLAWTVANYNASELGVEARA